MNWICLLMLCSQFADVASQLKTTKAVAKTTAKTTKKASTTTTTTTPDDYYYYYEYQEPPFDPNKTAYGAVICVSTAVCILLLYMALFGRRMKRTAIRWHVINCSFWSILHLASYASFAEKAPWPNYIPSEEWTTNAKAIECFTRSIFPSGMFFIYIETILLTCTPRLTDNWIFNLVLFIFVVPVLNAVVLFCFFAQWMEIEWFWKPIELLNLLTYVLFCLMTTIYFIFCVFGSCFCCFAVTSERSRKQRSFLTFVDMWLLFPYALIPEIMYGPSFGYTSINFAFVHLYDWLEEHGFFEGTGDGEDSELMLNIVSAALKAMPWFVLFFPLVQAVLAVICIRPFREQFFFLLSCGRIYSGAVVYKNEKEWALKGSTETLQGPIEIVKMESEPIRRSLW